MNVINIVLQGPSVLQSVFVLDIIPALREF